MNSNTIKAVQESWAKVVPIAPQAATIFYDKLFTYDPSLRSLFKVDMTAQKAHLVQILDAAVQGLDDLDALVPVLQSLAKRHVAYGVQDAHYATVGAALLDTLATGLGDDFTPAVKEAWSTVYGTMTAVMQAAAAEVSAVPVAA
ncbi:MAG: globin family protein [Caldilineaceae bacterium]